MGISACRELSGGMGILKQSDACIVSESATEEEFSARFQPNPVHRVALRTALLISGVGCVALVLNHGTTSLPGLTGDIPEIQELDARGRNKGFGNPTGVVVEGRDGCPCTEDIPQSMEPRWNISTEIPEGLEMKHAGWTMDYTRGAVQWRRGPNANGHEEPQLRHTLLRAAKLLRRRRFLGWREVCYFPIVDVLPE